MRIDMMRFNILILSVIFCAFIFCGNAFAGDIPTKLPGVIKDKDLSASNGPKEGALTETEKNRLVFNFDNADLSEVIRTLAELLEINYMLDSGVGGNVTIHTSGELSRQDLFPIFYQILDVNGLTAIKQNKIYKIVQAKDAPRLPIMSRVGRDDLLLPLKSG